MSGHDVALNFPLPVEDTSTAGVDFYMLSSVLAKMHRHALRLQHLQLHLDGGQMLSSFVRFVLPRFITFSELKSWIAHRSSVGIFVLFAVVRGGVDNMVL